MPTKENPIELGPGTVCFKSGESETWLPVNGIQEASLEPDEDYADTAPRVVGVDLAKEESITFKLEVPLSVFYSYQRFAKWAKMCRKYIHLARYGKNRRIRKKNLKRLIAVYEAGEQAIKL